METETICVRCGMTLKEAMLTAMLTDLGCSCSADTEDCYDGKPHRWGKKFVGIEDDETEED